MLPRLVEQTRILLWFQCFLTLIALLTAVVAGAILSGSTSGRTAVPLYDEAAERMDRIWLLMPLLAATAAVLALAAFLFRRGRLLALPVAFLSQAAVLTDMLLALRAGVAVTVVVALLTLLTLWILTNLLRRELRTHFLPG